MAPFRFTRLFFLSFSVFCFLSVLIVRGTIIDYRILSKTSFQLRETRILFLSDGFRHEILSVFLFLLSSPSIRGATCNSSNYLEEYRRKSSRYSRDDRHSTDRVSLEPVVIGAGIRAAKQERTSPSHVTREHRVRGGVLTDFSSGAQRGIKT